VRRDIEKLFARLQSPESPTGLFDRIFLEIEKEKELRRTRKLAFGFLGFLIVSVSAAPFSAVLLANEIKNSAIIYFISTMFYDIGASLAAWQEFSLAVAETLPVFGITIFTINIAMAAFTLRLFLHRKRLLLKYLFDHESK